MAQYEFREATPEDVQSIIATVRKENLDELEYVGVGIEDALLWSLNHSAEAFVAAIDGDTVCAFGVVATSDPEVGRPWMVGTAVIDKHPVAFLRGSREVAQELLRHWPVLRNVADARNTRGMRWLKFLGFEFTGVLVADGFTFHEFEKRSAVCAQG